MFRNISNLTLIGVLALLAAIYFGISYFNQKSRQGSLAQDLVKFDPAKATAVEIFTPEDTVFLNRQSDDWKVKLASGKVVDAEDETVTRALENLLTIKPSRLATKNKDKWKEFDVDSSGTRVKVYEKGKAALDLVIGRFGMNQQPGQRQAQYGMGGMGQFYSYVRLADEPEVYVANDFMGYSLPANASGYRNKQLLDFENDSISAIRFTYPADSSFSLEQTGEKWLSDGQPADSTAVASYLSDLRYRSLQDFADAYELSSLGVPELKAEIALNQGEPLSLSAYLRDDKWIVSSSGNENLFSADSADIHEIFVGRGRFMSEQD